MCFEESCVVFGSFLCALQGSDPEQLLYVHTAPTLPLFLCSPPLRVLYTWGFLTEQEGVRASSGARDVRGFVASVTGLAHDFEPKRPVVRLVKSFTQFFSN